MPYTQNVISLFSFVKKLLNKSTDLKIRYIAKETTRSYLETQNVTFCHQILQQGTGVEFWESERLILLRTVLCKSVIKCISFRTRNLPKYWPRSTQLWRNIIKHVLVALKKCVSTSEAQQESLIKNNVNIKLNYT